MSKISQKEYLKKYLSGKKKKRKEPKNKKVKLIDDDINANESIKRGDEDLLFCGEDAPQIVEIIDERSSKMETIDEFRKSGKWKTFSAVAESSNGRAENNKPTQIESNLRDVDQKSFESIQCKKKAGSDVPAVKKRKEHNNQSPDSDLSPRKLKVERRSQSSDIDASVKRKGKERKYNSSDGDLSPQRKRKESTKRNPDSYLSPQRKRSERRNRSPSGDLSPQRKRKERRNRSPSSDLSPRRIKKEPRHESPDSDFSPKRRGQERKSRSPGGDLSPQRKGRGPRNRSPDSDLSPQRKRISKDVMSAQKSGSKIFKGNSAHSSDQDLHPGKGSRQRERRRSRSPESSSKERPCGSSLKKHKHRSRDESESSSSMRRISPAESSHRREKTLDGKTAGLQNAATLKKELEQIRKKEDELYRKMSKDNIGKHSEVVVREKRTKGMADHDEEREERKRLEKEERRKTYSRWGMGVKQVEQYETKLSEDLYESSKPLARYSNDADLDKYLKGQERDGDPMLEYMRSKKREQDSNKPAIPVYKGSYPENRFNIKPGYRWDGVDRSNGYEAKWFTIQNEKKARQEEAYRYSTEDM